MVDDHVGHHVSPCGKCRHVVPRAEPSIDLSVIDRIETGVGAIDRMKEREHVHAAEDTFEGSLEQVPQMLKRPTRDAIDVRDQLRLILHRLAARVSSRAGRRHDMRGCDAVVAVSLILTISNAALAQTTLRAGAARVDVTPSAGELPKNNLGILDRLYARAIVLDNGTTSAALITVDAGAIPDALWQTVSGQIEKELGDSAGTGAPDGHSHAQRRRTARIELQPKDRRGGSAREAEADARSYRVRHGRLVHQRQPSDHRSENGAVVGGSQLRGSVGQDGRRAQVRRPRRRSPIAVYYNYAVHAVLAGQLDQISGDIPGAASRYVEDSFDDRIVALWSSGAAGRSESDLLPADVRPARDSDQGVREARRSTSATRCRLAAKGSTASNPAVARLMNQQRQMVSSMGQFLGEEVLHVMRGIDRTETAVPLSGSFTTHSAVPAASGQTKGARGSKARTRKASPVEIRLGLLRVGDVMIGAVNAEVFNPIAQRLKRESPYKATMMATLTNGAARSGYIPDDASFGK